MPRIVPAARRPGIARESHAEEPMTEPMTEPCDGPPAGHAKAAGPAT